MKKSLKKFDKKVVLSKKQTVKLFGGNEPDFNSSRSNREKGR
jgi:hypothetical protein